MNASASGTAPPSRAYWMTSPIRMLSGSGVEKIAVVPWTTSEPPPDASDLPAPTPTERSTMCGLVHETVAPVHVPAKHASFAVHASPSSHVAALSTCVQLPSSHTSSVHGLPSSQLVAHASGSKSILPHPPASNNATA